MKKLVIAIVLMFGMLVGCASKEVSMDNMSEAPMAPMEESAPEVEMEEIMDSATDSFTDGGAPSVSDNRKIIERVYLQVETKEFDKLMEQLQAEIQKAGGYVESSSVSGNSYYYDSNRYAEMVVRVPSNKSSEFTDYVSANGTVTNKEINTEDVTLSYVDMESRVTALQTEKESLERLLAAAETLEDIIKIQDRLTDVIYEIESYQSQLRMYDNLIDYTTITLHISEVEKVTIVEEQTVWEEIGTKLKNNLSDLKDDLVDLFVGIVSNIPYILIWAAIIGAGAMIVRKIVKKVAKKRNKE